MRILILDTRPWRKLEITRALRGHQDLTPLLEQDLDASQAQSLAMVILASEMAVREDPLRSLPRIRSCFQNARILILGDCEDATAIADLVGEGVDGYFLMSRGLEHLANAINVVARGSFWLPDRAATHVARKFRAAPDKADALNEIEQTLLQMVNEGLTNKEIAGRLSSSEMTIKRRLSRLYRRFRVRTRAQLLGYALRKGILSQR